MVGQVFTSSIGILLPLFFFILPLNQVSAGEYSTVYVVRVAAFEKTFDAIKLTERIGDLGVVSFVSSDKNMRVYLGKYLGRRTAERVLRLVKKRGFKDAYIISDNYAFTSKEGLYTSHTFQIGAFKRLDATNLNLLHEQTKEHLYITYENRVYRISVGLYNPLLVETKAKAMAIAETIGPIYKSGFDKQIRKVTLNPSTIIY